MKPLGLLLPIVVAVALIGLPSIGEAQVQRPARVVDGAHRGYLAVRLLEGGEHEVIDELNADRLFVPASVLKVVTVAAALEHLGAEYRWLTRLTSNGAIAGAVLDGDLVIEPGADPTWGEAFFDGGGAEPLADLAHQVRERGLTRISGDLVVDASRFPGRLHPTDRSYGDLPYRHGTPPAALAVDEATITVRVAPGASVGEPASVSAPAGVEVINHTTTVGRGGHGTLDFVPLWGANTLLLRGEYPISEGPFVVSASDPAPELRVARQLREALAEAGVTVGGAVRLQSRAVGAVDPLVALAELRSRPLEDVLERILTIQPQLVRRYVDPNVGAGGRGQRSFRRWRRGHLRLRHTAPTRRNEDSGEPLDPRRVWPLIVQPRDTHYGRARARICARAALGQDRRRGAGWTRRGHPCGVAARATDRGQDRNAASHRRARGHPRSWAKHAGDLLLLRQPSSRAALGGPRRDRLGARSVADLQRLALIRPLSVSPA